MLCYVNMYLCGVRIEVEKFILGCLIIEEARTLVVCQCDFYNNAVITFNGTMFGWGVVTLYVFVSLIYFYKFFNVVKAVIICGK